MLRRRGRGGFSVCIYMESAMQASAQVEGEEPFHVKVIAAPGADRERHREHRLAEKNNPDDKNCGKGPVRMGHLESNQHYRQIGKAH